MDGTALYNVLQRQRLRPLVPTYHDIAALRFTVFCEGERGSEAELRIVDYHGDTDASVVDDDAATGGNDGGNAGYYFIRFCCNWGVDSAAELEHNLDPSRVESIHKRSIFGLDTTTNR